MNYTHPILTEKEFCEILDTLEKENDWQNRVNSVISEKNRDSRFFPLDGLIDPVILLLERAMLDTPEYGTISYWVYELCFGKNYKKGCFRVKNGKTFKGNDCVIDINIKTAKNLYNFLKNNPYKPFKTKENKK